MRLDARSLATYAAAQMQNHYPDRPVSPDELMEPVQHAMDRHAHCFGGVGLKGAASAPNPLHTDQYAAFLYFLANTLHRAGASELAAKAYALNKALHALDIFYEVEMPAVFGLQHPVGTVVGRGRFADYLFVYQRCSVGSNLEGTYPHIGEGVVMFGGAAIIGDCAIGPNTWLSVGALVMDQDVPGDCVVFGQSPNLVIKPTKRSVKRDIFKVR